MIIGFSGTAKYRIDIPRSCNKGKIYDFMKYTLFGSYDITVGDNSYVVTKKENPNKMGYETNYKNGYFDSYGPRKMAYKMSVSDILSAFNKTDLFTIKGKESVRIYNKKRKRK